VNSLSPILGRIANPVKPFNFQGIHNCPLLVLFGDIHEGLGQPANLFEQMADGLVSVF